MRFLDHLWRPIDASALGVFRVLFGTAMVLEVVRFVALGRIERYYLEPTFHFTYAFFEWVKPWPGAGMYVHMALMGASALGIALGWWHRLCAGVFFLTYTYLFLIDCRVRPS